MKYRQSSWRYGSVQENSWVKNSSLPFSFSWYFFVRQDSMVDIFGLQGVDFIIQTIFKTGNCKKIKTENVNFISWQRNKLFQLRKFRSKQTFKKISKCFCDGKRRYQIYLRPYLECLYKGSRSFQVLAEGTGAFLCGILERRQVQCGTSGWICESKVTKKFHPLIPCSKLPFL